MGPGCSQELAENPIPGRACGSTVESHWAVPGPQFEKAEALTLLMEAVVALSGSTLLLGSIWGEGLCPGGWGRACAFTNTRCNYISAEHGRVSFARSAQPMAPDQSDLATPSWGALTGINSARWRCYRTGKQNCTGFARYQLSGLHELGTQCQATCLLSVSCVSEMWGGT